MCLVFYAEAHGEQTMKDGEQLNNFEWINFSLRRKSQMNTKIRLEWNCCDEKIQFSFLLNALPCILTVASLLSIVTDNLLFSFFNFIFFSLFILCKCVRGLQNPSFECLSYDKTAIFFSLRSFWPAPWISSCTVHTQTGDIVWHVCQLAKGTALIFSNQFQLRPLCRWNMNVGTSYVSSDITNHYSNFINMYNVPTYEREPVDRLTCVVKRLSMFIIIIKREQNTNTNTDMNS